MLNPRVATSTETHRRPYPTKMPARGVVGSRPECEAKGEADLLEGTLGGATWHPSSRRSKQVPCPAGRTEDGSLPRAGSPGIDHDRRVPTLRHSSHLARSDSRRTKDTAIALAWLRDRAPFDDVLTVIEVRRRFELSPDVARRYATNIVRTAGKMLRAERSNSSRKEIIHAVA